MLHVIAATLSLLLLAGMFSRCAESDEKDVAPSAEDVEADQGTLGIDGNT